MSDDGHAEKVGEWLMSVCVSCWPRFGSGGCYMVGCCGVGRKCHAFYSVATTKVVINYILFLSTQLLVKTLKLALCSITGCRQKYACV